MSHPPDDPTSPPGPTQSVATPSTSSNAPAKRLSLGERMRMARYAARLTQEELAGDSFSKSYISAVERNKMTPSISALRLLAERLSVTLAYLLGEQEDDPVIQPGQEPAPNASLSPDEQLLAQQFDETEKLLMNNAPTLALEHLGDRAALPPQHLAHWNWLAGWALLQLNRTQEAKDIIQQGFEAAQASHDLRAEGFLYFTLAKVNTVSGEQTIVDHSFQEAIRHFEQGSDYHMLICVYDEYSAFLAQQGRYKEAYEQMRHAQAASAHLQSKR